MKNRYALVITARMKSRRLPNKALLEINGRKMIEHIIDRAKIPRLPEMIILCTSTNPQDDVLCEIADDNGIEYFRGSEDDKLQRYLDASERFGFTHMIDVSGDNIFFDYECVDTFIEQFEADEHDVLFCDGLPLGSSPIGLKMSAVREVCRMKNIEDTEAYGQYFFNSKIFKVKRLKAAPEISRPDIRLTVDYPEDLELVISVFARMLPLANYLSTKEIVDLFNECPFLFTINRGAQERYADNFKTLPQPNVKAEFAKNFDFK